MQRRIKKAENASALSTMLTFADAFVELCGEMPLKKVSISDIIERTGKNRKTFYYHFENKDHLIIWIFRYDLGQALRNRFPESTLIYEEPSPAATSRLPFYIRQKSGIRSFNHAEFFDTFANVLDSRRSFYFQALSETGPGSLHTHLFNLYVAALKNDIDLVLSNRYLPKHEIDFLAEFYASAFLSYFIRRCGQPSLPMTGCAGSFANIIHSSLEMAINNAQLRRNL